MTGVSGLQAEEPNSQSMPTLSTTLIDSIEKSARDIRCTLESNDIKHIDNNLFPELIELLGYVFSNLENRTTLRIMRNREKPHNSFDYNLITALNHLAIVTGKQIGRAHV